jgi:hypothetical protein
MGNGLVEATGFILYCCFRRCLVLNFKVYFLESIVINFLVFVLSVVVRIFM